MTATTDLVMCCFRKKPFEDMMGTTPHIAQRLLEMTLDELDAAREWMLLLGRKTAREKIASLISIIARRDASLHQRRAKGMLTVDLPLTREEMADYLGLTLETVSRQISAPEEGRRDPAWKATATSASRTSTGCWKRRATTATAACWSKGDHSGQIRVIVPDQ